MGLWMGAEIDMREFIRRIDGCKESHLKCKIGGILPLMNKEVLAKTALVYDGNLSAVVAADGYFDALIPFDALLGLG